MKDFKIEILKEEITWQYAPPIVRYWGGDFQCETNLLHVGGRQVEDESTPSESQSESRLDMIRRVKLRSSYFYCFQYVKFSMELLISNKIQFFDSEFG